MEDQTEQEICAAYASGEDLASISRRLGVSQYLARKCLDRHGVQRRTRSEINTLRRPHVDPLELRQILDAAKLSHYETAAHFGVSTSTLTRVMRSLGYRSAKGHGSPLDKNYFWRGGRALDDDGYVLLKAPGHPHANNNGYVREHRLVMEQKLGRYLLPEEVVHHRDDDKSNNAQDNLEVYPTNADHLRATLTGKMPNFSEDGLRRIRENTRRVNQRRSMTSHARSKSDDRK